MVFELSDDDRKKIDDWLLEIRPQIFAKMGTRAPASLSTRPYYGAAGGGLEYRIVPTSIGLICKVIEFYTKLELDLSELD